jgi:hypothetical protein
MFDPGLIEFGGISLIAMVFGLVEFFKSLFKIEGKWVTVLAGAMGLLVLGLVEALQFLPAGYTQAAESIFKSFAFGLAAAGFYKFGTRNE